MRSILLAVALLLAGPATQAAETAPRTVSVQGTGSALGKPDLATARAGIESRGATPDEALSANTKVMNALMATIKRHGIAERDIETASFDVHPVYGQSPPRGAPVIEGYQVNNQLSIRVRDLAKLGGLLSALVESGANRLHGVSFDVADPAPLLDQARKAAVADARKRAELYAAAAGVRVKRVLSISEPGGAMPGPTQPLRAMKAGGEAVPVASGEHSVSASVVVVYEID